MTSGVLESVQEGEEAAVLEEVEVTEILELRESVVFEEVSFDADTAVEVEKEESEESPEGHPER